MSELEPTITELEPTATERLRALLDERGVDYRVSATGYSIDIGPYTTAYANRSDTTLDVSLRQVTPEQAIAATLGANDAKPTQDESSWTLTAEKVRELMEENSRQYPSPTDPYVWLTEYDWQAIADELNATLGSCNCSNSERTETCRNVHEPPRNTTFWPTPHFKCSECGEVHVSMQYVYFCPNCGRKVVDA